MKAVLILATAALAAAQGYFVGEPDCAIPCLTDAIGKVGCAAGDIKCQCSSDTQTALVPLVGPCLQSKCSAKELGQALQAGNDICSSYSAGKLTFTASPMPSSASAAMTTTAPSGSASASGTTLTEPLMSIQTSIPSNATASMSKSKSMSITSSASVTTSTGGGGGSSTGASTSADSSASASFTSAPANAAATQGVARVVGGVLAGMVGLAVAL